MKATNQQKKLTEAIQIPDGVEAKIEGKTITVKGKNGTIEKLFALRNVQMHKEGNKINIEVLSDVKKNKRIFYTIRSHVNNMLIGVQEGYTYKLKICSGHFPITVKIEGQYITISNFLGEKIPRKSKILPNVNVKIDKDMITVSSPDVESAGQTAANIEKATGVGKRDRRVFQDGCYIIEKPGRVFI